MDAFSEGSASTKGSTHTWVHNLIVLSNQLSEGSFLRWGLRVERRWEPSRPWSALSPTAQGYEGSFALPQAVCHLMPSPWTQKELVKTKTPKLSGTKYFPPTPLRCFSQR